MMKRMIALLLAVLMILLLVGCGADTSEEISEEIPSDETTTPDSLEEEEDPIAEKIEALLAEGDFEKICVEIDTVEELMQMLVVSGLKDGYGTTIEIAFATKVLQADKIIELACRILEEDYEEVGKITIDPLYYYFFYVKDDGVYYLYDVLRYEEGVDPGPYTSSEEMVKYAVMKRGGSDGTIQPWQPTIEFEAPNGKTLWGTTTCGISTFRFADTTIPVGLGLPELTNEEIDALLAENDPRKVKETISTLADFVNYCYRGEFIFGDGLIYFVDGNGRYVQTTSSGYQTLQMRMGQCASMSSCLHYVLEDDYDETGYVVIDQHIMAYIICDGLYYLVNPVEYVSIAYKNYLRSSTWLGFITGGESNGIYCSADFQDIADSLYGKDIGTEITYVYTMTGPGDFARNGTCNGPEGTTVIRWYGSDPVSYFSFTEYDWMSQENIVDRDAIVMFAPPGGRWVTYGGIHEDSYTAEQYPNSYLK